MIVRVTLLKKLDGMTKDAFHKYWKEVHAPLAARLDGLSLYHLNEVRGHQPQDTQMLDFGPIDGVAQLGFPSFQAMKKAGSTAAGKADRVNFIKDQQTLVCERTGQTPQNLAPNSVKCMIFMRRVSSLNAKDFENRLLSGKGDGIEQLPGFAGRVENLVVARWLEPWIEAPYDALAVDAVEELWFDDAQSLKNALSSHETASISQIRSKYIDEQLILDVASHTAIA